MGAMNMDPSLRCFQCGHEHLGPCQMERSITAMNNAASRDYPAREVEGHRLHVFQQDGDWHVWLNTGVSDFDGLCIAVGRSYDEAVKEAIKVLEASASVLQGPAWFACSE